MATILSQDIIDRIEISKIDPNPLAARLEAPNESELAASLSSQGQLTPVKVRVHPKQPNRYELIYGHRRLIAAKAIGWDRISAKIVQATDEEMLTFALTENLERDNYSDYEVAIFLKRLREKFHRSIDQIARMLGKSDAYVSQHLTMASMFDHPSINATDANDILKQLSERQARILVRVPDPAERLRLAKICVSEKLGVNECERFIGHPREVVERSEGHKVENWRTSRINVEEQITQIVCEILEGIEKKDIRPLISHRLPDSFTLYDDFPPLDLLDYDAAIAHVSSVMKQTDEIRLSHDKLKIHIFGTFAYATFFVTYEIRYNAKWHALRSRVTFIFTRKSKDWYIIHEHWSRLQHKDPAEFSPIRVSGGQDLT